MLHRKMGFAGEMQVWHFYKKMSQERPGTFNTVLVSWCYLQALNLSGHQVPAHSFAAPACGQGPGHFWGSP